MYQLKRLLGNQADAVIQLNFQEPSGMYKVCNSYPLIGLQRNMLYSKSNQRATAFLQQQQPRFWNSNRNEKTSFYHIGWCKCQPHGKYGLNIANLKDESK